MQQIRRVEKNNIAQMGTGRLGFWSAVLTAVFAAAAFAVGITTPPRSGPFCTSPCITYPYTDAAAFVPRDYLWMYPGIMLAVTLVVLIACVYNYSQDDKKVFGQIGVCFASISAALIILDYFIQLSVVQPSLLKGEIEGLSLFSQYNPHGIFIALEDAGYLMMSFSFLFAGLVFSASKGLERATSWLFVISSLAAIGALIGLSVVFGRNLEYRFEVTILTINWIVLIAAGVLLAVLFRRIERFGRS